MDIERYRQIEEVMPVSIFLQIQEEIIDYLLHENFFETEEEVRYRVEKNLLPNKLFQLEVLTKEIGENTYPLEVYVDVSNHRLVKVLLGVQTGGVEVIEYPSAYSLLEDMQGWTYEFLTAFNNKVVAM